MRSAVSTPCTPASRAARVDVCTTDDFLCFGDRQRPIGPVRNVSNAVDILAGSSWQAATLPLRGSAARRPEGAEMPVCAATPPTGRTLVLLARRARRTRGDSVVGTKSRDPTWQNRRPDRRRVCLVRAQALKLVPCGDGTKDHLPEGTRVPGSLAKTEIRMPSRAGGVVVISREKPLKSA